MPAPTSAAAGAAEGGPPRTELQELQLKAGQTTDEVSDTYIYVYIYMYSYVCMCISTYVRDVTATRIYDAATKIDVISPNLIFEALDFGFRAKIFIRDDDNRHKIFLSQYIWNIRQIYYSFRQI